MEKEKKLAEKEIDNYIECEFHCFEYNDVKQHINSALKKVHKICDWQDSGNISDYKVRQIFKEEFGELVE